MQHVQLNLWIRLYWTDPFLVWDPNNYGGVDVLDIPVKFIWTPDLFIATDVQREKLESSIDEMTLIVTSDGFVTYAFPRLADFTCQMAFRDFPFGSRYDPVQLMWSNTRAGG